MTSTSGRARSYALVSLSTIWLLAVALSTLTPGSSDAALRQPAETWCLFCGDLGSSNAVLNVVLFVPLGLLMAWAGRDWRVAIALGAVASVGIELAQISLPARHPAPADVLWNVTGSLLGALVHRAFGPVQPPSAARRQPAT
jgi:hypothetical protein